MREYRPVRCPMAHRRLGLGFIQSRLFEIWMCYPSDLQGAHCCTLRRSSFDELAHPTAHSTGEQKRRRKTTQRSRHLFIFYLAIIEFWKFRKRRALRELNEPFPHTTLSLLLLFIFSFFLLSFIFRVFFAVSSQEFR